MSDIIVLPQQISVTPRPPKFAHGKKPPQRGFEFKFKVLSEPDGNEGFKIIANLFVQAFVRTASGSAGLVDYILKVDGDPVRAPSLKRGRFRGSFDPNDFPPHQPLTFSDQVEFDVATLRGLHHFIIAPGRNSEFDKATIYNIQLEIVDIAKT